MQILITSEATRSADAILVERVSEHVSSALAEVADHITYAEVHFSDDQVATEGSMELRCLIEARLRGRQPMLVIHQAGSVDSAVAGALKSLRKVIDSAFARHREQFNRHFQPAAWPGTHE